MPVGNSCDGGAGSGFTGSCAASVEAAANSTTVRATNLQDMVVEADGTTYNSATHAARFTAESSLGAAPEEHGPIADGGKRIASTPK